MDPSTYSEKNNGEKLKKPSKMGQLVLVDELYHHRLAAQLKGILQVAIRMSGASGASLLIAGCNAPMSEVSVGEVSPVAGGNIIHLPVQGADQTLLGTLWIWPKNTTEPEKDELELFQVLADQVASTLENHHLSELSRTQNEFIIRNSRLATLGQMAAEIMHEINNPISIIQARIGLLTIKARAAALTNDMVEDSLSKLASTVDRVNTIIKGVKRFARDIEEDPFESVRVSEMLEYSLDFCRDRLKMNGLKLNMDPISSDLKVSCRMVQISQVIINLVNNAIDAVSSRPEGWIRINVAEKGDMVEIRVVDSGTGVPRELRDKLFQPFFTTKGDQGTGLGLSISRNIMEAHQGSLDYTLDSGHTAFSLTLPKIS